MASDELGLSFDRRTTEFYLNFMTFKKMLYTKGGIEFLSGGFPPSNSALAAQPKKYIIVYFYS